MMMEQFVAFECGIRGIAPQTISKTYLNGLRHMCAIRNSPSTEVISQAFKSDRCQLLLRGFQRVYDKIHPRASRFKAPFTLSMIQRSVRTCRADPSLVMSKRHNPELLDVAVFRAFTALCVGFFFLLRRSEYLGNPRRDIPPLCMEDIHFFNRYGSRVAITDIEVEQVTKVKLIIRHSKCDSSGRGRLNSHMASSSARVCIVRVLRHWCQSAYRLREALGLTDQSAGKTPLFDLPGLLPTLNSDTVNQVMKAIACEVGVPKERVSSHSLRYGGATAMAAAGLPQYVIAAYGGWTSDSESLVFYTSPSIGMVRAASEALSDPNAVDICDLVQNLRLTTGSDRTGPLF